MANEITFGTKTGLTLTFAVYTAAGVERESGTSMTETPASSGLYLGTPTTIVAGDLVVIDDGSRKVGWGEYQPDVDDSDIIAEIDANEAKIDTLTLETRGILNIYDETK